MFEENFNYFTKTLSGIIFIVIGFCFIFHQNITWNILNAIFMVGITIISILRIINVSISFSKIEKKAGYFGELFMWIMLLIICVNVPRIFILLLPRIIGIWIFIHAIVKLIVLWIKLRDHLTQIIKSFVLLVWDLFLSIILIFNPFRHWLIVSVFIGVYFIIHGMGALLEVVRELLPKNKVDIWDKKIRLAVPPYIAAMIPLTLIKFLLEDDQDKQIKDEFDKRKASLPTDLEILIHLAPSGPAKFGHMDMIYQNQAISYGCYDPHNRKLCGTLGDGVVIIAPRNTYIQNCIENENKVLVSFGLVLNKEQKEKLDRKLIDIFQQMTLFYSDEERKRNHLPYDGECDDYISRVTRTSPNSHFYKFEKGKFKTFFVLSTNCVYFISHLLSVLGLLLYDLSGIVSPGAYFDFLNNRFKSDKSFVVSRKVYRKK